MTSHSHPPSAVPNLYLYSQSFIMVYNIAVSVVRIEEPIRRQVSYTALLDVRLGLLTFHDVGG